MAKLAQATVLYLDAKTIGNKAGAECDKCIHYNDSGNCYVLQGKVKPKGVCGLYINGPKNEHDEQGKISQEAAGYMDNGPTHCASCKFFSPEGSCKIVEGKIEAGGCCNAWELDGYSKYIDSKEKK